MKKNASSLRMQPTPRYFGGLLTTPIFGITIFYMEIDDTLLLKMIEILHYNLIKYGKAQYCFDTSRYAMYRFYVKLQNYQNHQKLSVTNFKLI